MVSQTETKYY